MSQMDNQSHVQVLSKVLGLLESLPADQRDRVVETVNAFYRTTSTASQRDIDPPSVDITGMPSFRSPSVPFSEKIDTTPKEFLLQKRPKTDVERVACLAFYLTHYRATAHFKTTELTALNVEAAQPRFSNAAKAVSNATQYGYLAQAAKGFKQISAQGEQFVLALPDRDAAKSTMVRRKVRIRRTKKKAEVSHIQAEGKSRKR